MTDAQVERPSGQADDGLVAGRRGCAAVTAACFFGLCLTLLVYQPGYMTYDSFDQLKQARSGVLADNHPPMMAAIWRQVDRLSSGPFGMLLLQTVLFWGGIAVIFNAVPGPPIVRAVGAALVGFYPPVFGLIGTIWKDLLMFGVLMFAIGLMIHLIPSKRLKAIWAIAILGLLTVACSLRENAAAATGPLLIWLMHAFGPLRAKGRLWTLVRTTATALAATLLMYGASGRISSALTTTKTFFWQTLAVYDLVGISIRTDQMLIPDGSPVLRKTDTTTRDLRRVYDALKVNTLYRPPRGEGRDATLFTYTRDESELARISSAWKSAILEHPRAYLAHRWEVYKHVLALTPRGVHSPINSKKISENDLGITFSRSDLNDWVTKSLTSLFETPVYKPWVYIPILAVIALIGLVLYWKTGEFLTLGLSGSGLAYMLANFFVAPSSSFRYSLWGIIMVLVCTGYLAALASANIVARRTKAADAAPANPAAASSATD